MTNFAILLAQQPLYWDRRFGEKITIQIYACVLCLGEYDSIFAWVTLEWKNIPNYVHVIVFSLYPYGSNEKEFKNV